MVYASCCQLKCNSEIIWGIFFDPDDVKNFGGSILKKKAHFFSFSKETRM